MPAGLRLQFRLVLVKALGLVAFNLISCHTGASGLQRLFRQAGDSSISGGKVLYEPGRQSNHRLVLRDQREMWSLFEEMFLQLLAGVFPWRRVFTGIWLPYSL